MNSRFYTTSQSAWGAMLTEIKKAQKSIYIEMYIFLENTGITHDFIGILQTKAQAGVKVIVIVDAYGSFDLKKITVDAMRQSGVEFLFFSSWFQRTHRKIVIIDEKIAFLGGVNIKEKIRYWHDLQIKLTGKIVKPIIKSFARSYYQSGGTQPELIAYRKKILSRKLKSWVIDNWAQTSKRYQLSNYYREKISSAKKSIDLVTPYFLPPRWLIRYLISAVNRGIIVDIIIPADTDVKSLNKINYLNACRLAAAGVRFFLTPQMNHAKIMLIDQEEGMVGSQNLDFLSFSFNVEAGIFFKQKKMVSSLAKIVTDWKAEAEILNLKKAKPGWWDQLLTIFLQIFYPVF